MNVTDFTYLLQNPNEKISVEKTIELEEVLEEYPYFQAARAVHLKGLKKLNSFKYNKALKIAAAYTTDRDILFDFITSEEFLQDEIANTISGKKSAEILLKNTEETSAIASNDTPLPRSIADADQILDPGLFVSKDPKIDIEIKAAKEKAKKELEIGAPLHFTKTERHSFSQWLQLASQKKVQRVQDSPNKKTQTTSEKEGLKKKKADLIDKFITESPKIIPKENISTKVDKKKAAKFDDQELMTETLAKVYLEQEKYKKAIQAYKILSLKYPEKSGFFADRIKAIQKLKQEKS